MTPRASLGGQLEVLVTGGAGFIGSSIVDALILDGHNVRILDDLSTGFEENLNPKATAFIGDVANEALVREAVAGANLVFHEAASRAVQKSVDDPLATDTANIHGTLTVLKASLDAGVRRVVYASSSSIYGGAEHLPTPETAPIRPRSPYAVTKAAAEQYCTVFAELYGLETVSLRYFNVFGPRQRPDSAYAAVIPLFIEALSRREAPTVHGDGLQSRDFTYVDDVVAANFAAACAPAENCSGRAFNIAGGRTQSLLDILALLSGLLGVEVAPVHTDARPGDIRHSSADVAAARAALAYETTVSFDDGLAHTLEWFAARQRAVR